MEEAKMCPTSSSSIDTKRRGLSRCLTVFAMTLVLCELVLFFAAAAYCDVFISFEKHATLPANTTIEASPHESFTSLVISDVHLLGHLRRSWLDRVWTDWQLRKSIYTLGKWFNPELVVALGDHLDEGDIVSNQVFKEEARKFHRIMSLLPSGCKVLTNAIGNHDAGSSTTMSIDLVRRFEEPFGETSVILRHRGVEFVVVNGIGLDIKIRGPSVVKAQTTSFLATIPRKSAPRVLLLHVPLFRENDLDCGIERSREAGHVTYLAPHETLKPFEDVLTEDSSKLILETVAPDFILSGHTHARCTYVRDRNMGERATFEESNLRTKPERAGSGLTELTLPTFSWRMRPDPGFAILQVSDQEIRGKICKLPNEYLVFCLYLLLIPFSVTFCMQGFLVPWHKKRKRK